MRNLTAAEIQCVAGGQTEGDGISGYEGAGAILAVLATGAAISTAPISAPVIGLALGASSGLAVAQWLAENS